jgi:nicotinamidase-related amidase
LIDAVAPIAAEAAVEKTLPNSFAGTDLHVLVTATGRKQLILAGFMTRARFGYRTTVVAAACATRDSPDGLGESSRLRPSTKSH